MHIRRALALAVIGSVGVVSGCAGGGERETVVVTSTQWVDPDSGEVVAEAQGDGGADGAGQASDWQDEYEWVLAHPGDYPVNSAAQYTPDGTYEYALVEATGGGTPELLLAVGGSDASPVIVFTVGKDGKAHASQDVLMMGAPNNGPGRLAVFASSAGSGVYQIGGSAGSREWDSELFTLESTSLRGGVRETFPRDSHLPDHQLIEWIPVSDTRPLHDGTLTVLNVSGARAGASETPAGAGQVEFVGNVVRKTGEELMAPRGLGMPNGQDPQSEYFLLWLDQPMSVTGKKDISTETKQIEYVTLGSREYWPSGPRETHAEWEQYVGKRMRFVKDKDDVYFPSDTTMPLGSTWMGDAATFDVLN